MTTAFGLLALAIACVWVPDVRIGRRAVPVWTAPFLAAVVAGLAAGILTAAALAPLAVLGATAWIARRASRPTVRTAATLLAAVVALALALHLLPGFANPVLVQAVRLGDDAAPFTLRLNADKAAAGLLLLAAFAPRITRADGAGRGWGVALAIAAVTVAATVGTAVAVGQVRFDPKLPPWTATFLVANLLFTCVAEEAFFRGLVQHRLAQALARRGGSAAWRRALPIAASALLFGLAHAGGGAVGMALAALVGLGCALAFAATRRIEAAVLTHFAVNAVHFLGFTYPFLAR